MVLPNDQQVDSMMNEIAAEESPSGEAAEQEQRPEGEVEVPKEIPKPEKVALPDSRKGGHYYTRKRVEELTAKVDDLTGKLSKAEELEEQLSEYREHVARVEGQIEMMAKMPGLSKSEVDDFEKRREEFRNASREAVKNSDWDGFYGNIEKTIEHLAERKAKALMTSQPAQMNPVIVGTELKYPHVVDHPRGRQVVRAQWDLMRSLGKPVNAQTLDEAFKAAESMLGLRGGQEQQANATRESMTGMTASGTGQIAKAAENRHVTLPPAVVPIAKDMIRKGYFRDMNEYAELYALQHPESVS